MIFSDELVGSLGPADHLVVDLLVCRKSSSTESAFATGEAEHPLYLSQGGTPIVFTALRQANGFPLGFALQPDCHFLDSIPLTDVPRVLRIVDGELLVYERTAATFPMTPSKPVAPAPAPEASLKESMAYHYLGEKHLGDSTWLHSLPLGAKITGIKNTGLPEAAPWERVEGGWKHLGGVGLAWNWGQVGHWKEVMFEVTALPAPEPGVEWKLGTTSYGTPAARAALPVGAKIKGQVTSAFPATYTKHPDGAWTRGKAQVVADEHELYKMSGTPMTLVHLPTWTPDPIEIITGAAIQAVAMDEAGGTSANIAWTDQYGSPAAPPHAKRPVRLKPPKGGWKVRDRFKLTHNSSHGILTSLPVGCQILVCLADGSGKLANVGPWEKKHGTGVVASWWRAGQWRPDSAAGWTMHGSGVYEIIHLPAPKAKLDVSAAKGIVAAFKITDDKMQAALKGLSATMAAPGFKEKFEQVGNPLPPAIKSHHKPQDVTPYGAATMTFYDPIQATKDYDPYAPPAPPAPTSLPLVKLSHFGGETVTLKLAAAIEKMKQYGQADVVLESQEYAHLLKATTPADESVPPGQGSCMLWGKPVVITKVPKHDGGWAYAGWEYRLHFTSPIV